MHSIRSRLVELCALAAFCGASGFAPHAAAVVLYRWVDADGIVHYSDRPAPGAEKVQIASAQTYKSTPVRSSGSVSRPAPLLNPPKYKRVEVTRPTDGQSFVDSTGKVDAAVAVDPSLASNHQLWFLIDGTRQPEPAGPTLDGSFEVARGTHTLAAVITDEQGRELVTSAPVTFYVLQHSIAKPPRGPALTPK